MREINASIPFDKALWRQDIRASKAHVAMLGAQGIVSAEDAATISAGLDTVAGEYEVNGVPENWDLEDIHMTTESRLAELVGPAAGRLHTARSRNDQVATDFRLWVRDAVDEALAGLNALQKALVARAGEHVNSIMPGFTHLQTAQPVTLGHHLMAYYEMAARDVSRFADARARMNQSPLGSAGWRAPVFPSTVSPRPRRWISTVPLTTASIGVGPRFRARLPDGGGAMLAAPLASGRGIHHLGFAALRLCPPARQSRPAAASCRKRRTPTPPNWCAVMPGASSVL
jgi:hypothetical protein